MDTQGRINALKQLLNNSDYKVLKHVDGDITEEEYEDIREQRRAWRKEINELEDKLNEIEQYKEIVEEEL